LEALDLAYLVALFRFDNFAENGQNCFSEERIVEVPKVWSDLECLKLNEIDNQVFD
jgi:hypothetical protein